MRNPADSDNIDFHWDEFEIRPAEERDIPDIYDMLIELATYENIASRMVATREQLHDALFVRHEARAIVGAYRGCSVAFALYYDHFATFTGRVSLFMEELYVREAIRGRGVGKAMFSFLAGIAKRRNLIRMEWPCMADNTPAIEFYGKLGAEILSDRVLFRLSGDALTRVASRQQKRERA